MVFRVTSVKISCKVENIVEQKNQKNPLRTFCYHSSIRAKLFWVSHCIGRYFNVKNLSSLLNFKVAPLLEFVTFKSL